MQESGQNCTIPDHFLSPYHDASFGGREGGFSVLECGVGWKGLWVERKPLSPAAGGDLVLPTPEPVFPFLPPLPSLPL